MSLHRRLRIGSYAGAMLCGWMLCGLSWSEESNASASTNFVIEKINSVPSMTVRAMVQAQDGYLWFGGYTGLFRFDGVRAVVFTVANTGLSELRTASGPPDFDSRLQF